jgi:hypothetical protein
VDETVISPVLADANAYSLDDALQISFSMSDFVLATFGQSTVGILRKGSTLWLFDSHARDFQVHIDGDGAAVMLHFSDLRSLHMYLCSMYRGAVFNLTPVKIGEDNSDNPTMKLNIQQTDAVENNENNYCQLSPSTNPKDYGLSLKINDTTSSSGNVHIQEHEEPFAPNNCTKPVKTPILVPVVISPSNSDSENNMGNTYYEVYATAEELEHAEMLQQMRSYVLDKYMCSDENTSSYASSQKRSSCDWLHELYNMNNVTGPHSTDSTLGSVSHVEEVISLQKLSQTICLDHSYMTHGKRKSKQKGSYRKKKKVSDLPVVTSFQYPVITEDLYFFSEFDLIHNVLNVGRLVEVETQPDFIDVLFLENHVAEYEKAIRITFNDYCFSCHKLLFPDQIQKLSIAKMCSVSNEMGVDKNSTFCCTCCNSLRSGKVPSLSCMLNDLFLTEIPEEMSCLNRIGKKLLSKIQTCMTMIILPGGQFAEKGLVLNLPVDIQAIMNQLPFKAAPSDICCVKFEAGKPQSTQNYFVRPLDLAAAFKWLHGNNHLYSDLVYANSPKPLSALANQTDCHSDRTYCNELQVILSDLEEASMIPVDYDSPLRNHSISYTEICVPCSTSEPVSVYNMQFGEESAFPWLYPHGRFGFSHVRMQNVSTVMYFRNRLCNKDPRFRTDMTYLLSAAASVDVMMLKSEVSVYLRMRQPLNSSPSTASDVRSMHENTDVSYNSYMFMKNIRGTVAYFRNALYDLLAMFRTIGPPTIFMTLSADDLHWPELGMLLDNLPYEEASRRGNFFSSMRSNPFIAATHFHRRFRALMKFILNQGLQPLGKIIDHFVHV